MLKSSGIAGETEIFSLEEHDLDQTQTHKLLIGIKTNLDWSFGLMKDSQSQKWKFDMSCTDQLVPLK